MAVQAIPAKDETYIIGDENNSIGRENQDAELFLNRLFDMNYITQLEARTYILVDPLVSGLTREVITDTVPDTATIPNNREVI